MPKTTNKKHETTGPLRKLPKSPSDFRFSSTTISTVPLTGSAPRIVFQMFQASMKNPARYIAPPSARMCIIAFVEVTTSTKFG